MQTSYDVTIETGDSPALLHCLRALAFYSERLGKRGAIAGASDGKWRAQGHRATFRFTDLTGRDTVVFELKHLVPADRYAVAEPASLAEAA